jgi:hypothetical protein
VTTVVSVTLLYTDSDAVIPAKSGIQNKKTGFRVKPGLTKGIKLFIRQHTLVEQYLKFRILLNEMY